MMETLSYHREGDQQVNTLKLSRGDRVRVDTGDRNGIVNGRVRAVLPSNRNNPVDDDRLVHTIFLVELTVTCLRYGNLVDTVKRFYQRRSGHVFQSNHWKLLGADGEKPT